MSLIMGKTFAMFGAAVLLSSALSVSAYAGCYDVVPLPRKVEVSGGEPFVLTGDVRILYEGKDLERNAGFLAGYISEMSGLELETAELAAGESAEGSIIMRCSRSASGSDEGYVISVGSGGIEIVSPSPAGVFYAVQTLRKSAAVLASGGRLAFPAARIEDSPEFAYRGAHFDVCRHFFTEEEVKEYIDMMVLHNMNRLHWHITDDQGWRVEIKRYPELTEIGSVREETLTGHLNDRPEVYDGVPYGGFFTQDQIREIVKYAADRYVTVIPEVDLPGHMQAALAAYPELGCTGGPYKVWTKWGVSEEVLCAGNDKVLEFLRNVFTEIMDLFPSEYIHIGGDECPKVRWENCPKCQAKADALGFEDDESSTRGQKLQGYVMQKVASFLNGHGRKVICWDEILESEAAEGVTVMSWRGEAGGILAARLGHDVIMAPNTYMYFDYYQGKDPSKEPLSIGGYIPIESVYRYSPLPKALSRKERKHILGVQANLWTEYIHTFRHAQYMVLPRWSALAENQWNPSQKKDYKRFLDRLQNMVLIYDMEGYTYAKHVFGVESSWHPDTEKKAVTAVLETMGDAPVHYTLDGSMPDETSPLYEGPLEITSEAVLTAAAFRGGEPGPVMREKVSFNMATACPVTLLSEPCSRYSFDGARMLTDGLEGDLIFGSGRWLGFEGTDMAAAVDLGRKERISSAAVNICVNTADGVFDARSLKVYVSDDGKRYRLAASEEYPEMTCETKMISRHFLSFPETEARYVKVVAETEKSIPLWSWLAGSRAFLFADEIKVGGMTPAASSPARFVGRVRTDGAGAVEYDWTGTYFTAVLEGGRLDAGISCRGESWFNVFADGKPAGKVHVNSADTVVTLVSGLGEGRHRIMVQKRTEGEYGKVSVKGFILPLACRLLPDEDVPQRHIEFIGNSLTCGFGTEGADRDEPFKVSTENCNLSYAAVIARHFGADYTFIAHSGQGAVRNYGDSLTVSPLCMRERMMRLFDTDTAAVSDLPYEPDLVVINLGTNDFSLPPFPSEKEFVEGYCIILKQIRSLYGDVPVLCVCPPSAPEPAGEYIRKAKEAFGDSSVYVFRLPEGLYNMTSDLGSAWHPNYSGQKKMAMSLIPFISTITGWDMPEGRPVE